MEYEKVEGVVIMTNIFLDGLVERVMFERGRDSKG